MPSSATKAVRIFRPASVRIGMFWRFGSEEDSRPVVVAASAKEVWTRPLSRSMCSWSESV